MHATARQPLASGAVITWDLTWNVLTNGSTPVAIVTASVRTTPAKPKDGVPPLSIAHLAYSLKGRPVTVVEREPIQPRGGNAMVGEIPENYAERIFAALDAGTPITVEATYASGEQATLVMQAHGGFYDGMGMYTDRISSGRTTVQLCMEHLVPASLTLRAVVERAHVGS